MNRNCWYRCLAAAVAGLALAACGEGAPPGSSSDGVQADRDGAMAGMLVCDIALPAAMDTGALIPAMEIDRTYQAARPGFIHQWIALGAPRADGTVWAGAVVTFHSTGQAQAFSDFLDNDFILYGSKFWERPYFLGHQCDVWEVLGSVDRPSNDANQVAMRIERFPLLGTTRAELRAWFADVRVEALRQGHTSVTLLYSEGQRMASLVYFGDVPRPRRSLGNPNPIAARSPIVQDAVFDQSGWNLTSWFPFEAGDRGRPAIWPMPGIEAFEGDGVCEVSRHESSQTTTDCLATCGNAAQDAGETEYNCPGDVRPFD